jgi:hypothetical protein
MDSITEGFLQQNPLTAEGLDHEVIAPHTTHHSGGLIVMFGYAGDSAHRMVKMHDSWGDTTHIVVHIYEPDDEAMDHVYEFTDAQKAYAKFIELTEGA